MRNLTSLSRRTLGGSVFSVVIVGLLIGVAGNSLFDFLHSELGWGSGWLALSAIAALLVASLILILLVRPLLALLRARRELGLATQRGVPPAPGLIVLISQPAAGKDVTSIPAFAAINHHLSAAPGQPPPLKRLWLIATSREQGTEQYARQLAQMYKGRVPCYVHTVADSDSAQETFELMQDIYRAAGRPIIGLKGSDIVADCTGATKPMSVGMALAVAADPSRRLSYIPRDPAIPPLLVRMTFFAPPQEELEETAMIIVNFSHPLTEAQLAELAALTGEAMPQLINVSSQLDVQQPLASQVTEMVEAAALTPTQWQGEAIIVNLPALNYSAALLLAELHGRMGYFPTCLRLRPTAGAVPPRYEVAELLSLQELRDEARARRR